MPDLRALYEAIRDMGYVQSGRHSAEMGLARIRFIEQQVKRQSAAQQREAEALQTIREAYQHRRPF